MTGNPVAAVTWLELDTEDAGRWTWAQRLSWPFPLSASSVGRWEPELTELLESADAAVTSRQRGEERLLAGLAEILAAPDYCAYVVRTEAGVDRYWAGIARGDDAVVVVDEPGRLRIGRVHPTLIAASVAAQLPVFRAAPVVRVTVAAQTAALLQTGFQRPDLDSRTLHSALRSAGVPDAMAQRFFAAPDAIVAVGSVGAVSYRSGDIHASPRAASWTELPEGGMISAQSRTGDLSWEPLTVAAVGRALADALGGLG